MLPTPSHTREEYLRKKRNKKLFRYGVVALIVVCVIALLSYISHRPKIRISKVELVGGVLVSPVDVQTESMHYISGYYLWLFPKNDFFLYPKGGLMDYLKNTFKRIDTIHIYRKGLNTLVVEITERKPIATWCGNTPPQAGDSEQCYFLDSNSAIFAEAPIFSGDAYFKYYGLVGTSTPIGSYYVASTTEFEAMTQFVTEVKKLSFKPLYITDKGEGQFSMVLANGGQIYFDTKESFSKVLTNLEALLRTPAFPKDISSVEYIDLRFGNKLFYKLK